jgi:Cu/Ag efflux protein CusF
MKRLFITFWMLLVLAALAWAHGDEQHVMGTVAKIDGTNITVKAQDGSLKTVMVTSETKYVKAGSPAKLDDVKVGDRVVIHAKRMGDMLHATEVKIGEASKAAAH